MLTSTRPPLRDALKVGAVVSTVATTLGTLATLIGYGPLTQYTGFGFLWQLCWGWITLTLLTAFGLRFGPM